jgi:hypothetical protein
MKKIFLGLFMLSTVAISAQEIGVRFGEVSGNNVAVDGVFETGSFSRVHANISFGGDGVGLDALWDFIYRPLGGESFNWYVGFGPSAYIGDLFLLGASGEIGLEYVFNEVPIAIGLDYRPTFWIIENTDFDFGGFGLNIRYRF